MSKNNNKNRKNNKNKSNHNVKNTNITNDNIKDELKTTNNTLDDTSITSDDNNGLTSDNNNKNNEAISSDIISDDVDTSKIENNDNIPHLNDFMGNGNEIFSTYKNKYENTMSSAVILLFFGVFGILSTIGILAGYINLTLSTFQHVFLTTLYLIFFVYGIISYFKALDYKEHISTENTMEDTIIRYLENHITKEFIDSLYDNSITDEENYVVCINKIQTQFLEENPDFNKDLVEYHIDNYLNENF